MGGSILFTESATFEPSIYGLTAGKFINYIIIGGGGAGCSMARGQYYYNSTSFSGSSYTTSFTAVSGGTNGGTSSIGIPSPISALGGATSVKSDSFNNNLILGGSGGRGWIPGKIFQGYSQGSPPVATASNSTVDSSNEFSVYYDGGQKVLMNRYGDAGVSIESYPVDNITKDYNGLGLGIGNPYDTIQATATKGCGNDGIGYGAGGGGHAALEDGNYMAGYGGDPGQFKMGSFKLTNTNSIPITIGKGGIAHTIYQNDQATTSFRPSNRRAGRNGTHGAVMLFWD